MQASAGPRKLDDGAGPRDLETRKYPAHCMLVELLPGNSPSTYIERLFEDEEGAAARSKWDGVLGTLERLKRTLPLSFKAAGERLLRASPGTPEYDATQVLLGKHLTADTCIEAARRASTTLPQRAISGGALVEPE